MNAPTVSAERVHVLACGVLAVDLRALAPELDLNLTLDFLPGQLHTTPVELRRRLQERIDAVSASGAADRLVVAYGMCGRGTVGLHARGIPVDIPRVHDCIALFLGSDAAYREQFGRYPGTYYVSAGWVREGMGASSGADSPDEEDLAARHGAENAEAVRTFLGSWRRNYQRAAFIDTGVGDRHHAQLARDMAAANGWIYEELPGSHDVLRALLRGQPDERILRVAPGLVTTFDAVARCLTARPPQSASSKLKPAVPAASARARRHGAAGRTGCGLGIDAGGTYTDAVIFDWTTDRVVAKAKAPTSHWDYAIGIEAALAGLPPEALRSVTLVAVSTTLATNAIVEGKGQKVGLLLMPPAGDRQAERLLHRPFQVIRGRLSIDGQELEPIDPDEVRRVAREMAEHDHVRAFAVTGYASHVNPNHELAVVAEVRQATGLPATCGHEVSSIRNYRIRAETAALNARIIPCLQALMERLREVLARKRLTAPLMVVRSDGTLMSIDLALERPVETLLSGPAASVAGAQYLSDLPDALVIDMGGTTSDTAVLHQGAVKTDPDGATVGHWRTHVQALAVRTLGLGGDSEVRHDRHGLHIGPRRVLPVCRLTERVSPEQAERLWRALETQGAESTDFERHAVYIALPQAGPPPADLTPRQQAVLALLAHGPLSVHELVAATGCLKPVFLEVDPLLDRLLVQRLGFTPTDALHLLGRLCLWDAAGARRYAALLGAPLGWDADELARRVESLTVRRAARELLMTRLNDLTGSRSVDGDHGFVAQALLDRGLGETQDSLGVDVSLGVPIIGIGAPAAFFLPAAAGLLHTEAVIPVDGDVANAIGAITSGVLVERRAAIQPDEQGLFHVQGLPGAPVFKELEAAEAFCVRALGEVVRELAGRSGAVDPVVTTRTEDRLTVTAEGLELFVARRVIVSAAGQPVGTARLDA